MTEVDRRLTSEPDNARAVRLMTATYVLAGLRLDKNELSDIFRGVRVMHESTAYDMWVEEYEKAKLEGKIQAILRLGERRLGNIDDSTKLTLADISDAERIDRMLDAVITVSSWQELLATW